MSSNNKEKETIINNKVPIGKGFESIVYVSKSKKLVVKIPNTEEVFNDYVRTPQLLKWLSSEEHGAELEKDHQRAKKIFGENIIASHFISIDHPFTGTRSFAQVQQNFLEEGFIEWSRLKPGEQIEAVSNPEGREKLLNFLWQIKSFCFQFRVPFDLESYGNNIAYNKVSKSFIVIEAGFPTELRRLMSDSLYLKDIVSKEVRINGIDRFLRVNIPFLRRFDESVKVTPAELDMLNERFFGNKQFDFEKYLDELVEEFESYKNTTTNSQ